MNLLCQTPLFFSETWLDLNEPIHIPGYVGHHTVRQGRSGGVSLFVKQSLSSEKIEQFSYANENIEICTVKISSSSSNIILCGIYRPHSGTIENFTISLESILEHNIFGNSTCIIGGDYNINMFSECEHVDRFIDMMRSHHYIQTITDITHPGSDLSASSLIDHIWINQLTSYHSGIIRSGITDHYTTFIQIPFTSKKII